MWFLNKLGAVLSTENWIFCITYPDYIFIKNWKNGYAVKKKKTTKKPRKSIWPRICGYGDAAVTQRCIYVSKTVRHCAELGTLACVASSV